MTDHELDQINEQVARKLGWTLCDEDPLPDLKEWHSPGNGEGICTNTLPDYSRSIAAAWEIVPRFDQLFSIEYFHGEKKEKWRCNVGWTYTDNVENTHGYGPAYSFDAATAPLAICQAFLNLPDDK